MSRTQLATQYLLVAILMAGCSMAIGADLSYADGGMEQHRSALAGLIKSLAQLGGGFFLLYALRAVAHDDQRKRISISQFFLIFFCSICAIAIEEFSQMMANTIRTDITLGVARFFNGG